MSEPSAPRAPRHARTVYKCVGVSHSAGSPVFFSIFDGRTQYALDSITAPPGGAYVCPDLLSAVRHGGQLPRRSRRLDARRAILQCLAWNEDGTVPNAAHSNALKLRVSHVLPTAVLPYTATAQPYVPEALDSFYSDGIATLSARPQTAPAAARRPRELTTSAGLALRIYGGGLGNATRMQAQTASMHEDVLLAEARLARLREIRLGGMTPSTDWQRRALVRYGIVEA